MQMNVYYSRNFKEKIKFQEFFVKNFLFKDKNNPLSGKLIDVFFYKIENFDKDTNVFDVILVDDYLIDEIYDNEELQCEIYEKWCLNSKSIIFITLSENYYQIKKWSSQINFLRAFGRMNVFEFLFTEIAHDILRFISNKDKMKIFISHSKKDGKYIAMQIKEFIDSDLKLSNFFDEIDIQNSDNWQTSLRENIKDRLFLYILTDFYGHTKWTKQELIWAKELKVPIIGVDMVGKINESLIPYISNTKLVKLTQEIKNIELICKDRFSFLTKHNIRTVINELLKTALEYYLFQKEYGNNQEFSIFCRKPDLFDLCNCDKDVRNILYPDPPMMNIEKEVIEKCSDKKLFTLLTKEIKNTNKKIAISISEPPDLDKRGMTIHHLNLVMVEIARYLIVQNNILIYGGDLGYKSEFNFTEKLAELFYSYNKTFDEKKKIVNYSAYPFCKKIDLSIKNRFRDVIKFEDCIGEDCNFDEIDKVANNLTKMRKIINEEMDIKVALGGKITGFSGFYPGVLEEVYLALKSGKSIFLIGGFGGIVAKIVELLKGYNVEELTFKYQKMHNEKLDKFLKDNPKYEKEVKNKYDEMYNFIKTNGMKLLNNGLSLKDNDSLFKSKNIEEIVSLILKGINNI